MELVSLRAYARHRGVSLRAVQKAVESKRIEKTADGRIDLEAADAQWKRNTGPRPSLTKSAPSPAPASRTTSTPEQLKPDLTAPGGLDYSRARAVRESYLARLAKIDFEERSGKLVSRDEVQVAAFNRFRAFRDGMLNIPDRLAAVLAAEADATKVRELLTNEIRKALLEFADDTNSR